ncbi:hypothetical protein RhiirA4_477690 [Rhizophagus irregularis]|uniref:Uncharacterized protein n=1 Tax=Rhizophagus irregularis TaxID=588596 RepID=A0A2I1HDP4_9GLOM|nr:hypothetical protein RhiirA4_477690 [Rhizophagus irregularis]
MQIKMDNNEEEYEYIIEFLRNILQSDIDNKRDNVNNNNIEEIKKIEEENIKNREREGTYPPTVNHTEAPNYFPIPDNYIIKTTWGRASRSRTIQCSIYYAEEKPHYLICFGDNLQYQIITPDKKTAVSGVYLFGLQLKCIDRNRKGLAKKEQIHFENSIKDFYNPKNRIVLRTLDFTIENKEYHVTFEDDDKSTLSREYAISQTCQEINACMEELIPINFIDLNSTIVQEGPLEEPDITDLLIIEQVVSATGKGAYRSYIKKGVLDPAIPTIHLRISGDRWNRTPKNTYTTQIQTQNFNITLYV